MRIPTFGRTLGLGAVLLSAILLIVALMGGIASKNSAAEAMLTQAISVHEELPLASGWHNRSGQHDAFSASDPAGRPGFN